MEPNENKGVDGNTTEVLVNGDFSLAVRKEKSLEVIGKMLAALNDGNKDIAPFVMGIKDGKIFAEECLVKEDGTIELPELRVNTKDDLVSKSKTVRRILKEISPVLVAEIENVTYMALMRKDRNKLMEVMSELKQKKTKPRLQNRAGCIWLIIGDYEFVL